MSTLPSRPIQLAVSTSLNSPPVITSSSLEEHRSTTILTVDDNPDFQELLTVQLNLAGYHISCASSGAAALQAVRSSPPDLILLELRLPDIDGISLCRTLKQYSNAPIIVVSCYLDEARKVAALDAGADDYVTKPLPLAEFQARVRVALRKARPLIPITIQSVITVGDIEIDLAGRLVCHGNRRLSLTRTEWELFLILAQAPDQLHTYEQLMYRLWGGDAHRDVSVLHTFIAQLRRKLGIAPLIENVRGVGYRLQASRAV